MCWKNLILLFFDNPFKLFENQSHHKGEKSKNEYVSVKKWIDYSSKYGIGYILSNNSYGVFFNDSTKILLLTQEEFYYIEKLEREDTFKKYSFKDYIKKQLKITLIGTTFIIIEYIIPEFFVPNIEATADGNIEKFPPKHI